MTAVPACPFAVFDELGVGACDRVQDYAAQLVAAERERCAAICDVTPPYPFRASIEAAQPPEPVAWAVYVGDELMQVLATQERANDWVMRERQGGSAYAYHLRMLYAAVAPKG